MAAAGLLTNDTKQASEDAYAALRVARIFRTIASLCRVPGTNQQITMRVGLHSGARNQTRVAAHTVKYKDIQIE